MLGRERPPNIFRTSVLGVNLLGVEAGHPSQGRQGELSPWLEVSMGSGQRVCNSWLNELGGGWGGGPDLMSPVLSFRVVPVGASE